MRDEMLKCAQDMLASAAKNMNVMTDLLARRNEEIARLREALEFYADPGSWSPYMLIGPNGDYGKTARQALEITRPLKEGCDA